jgi:hypothetical protein
VVPFGCVVVVVPLKYVVVVVPLAKDVVVVKFGYVVVVPLEIVADVCVFVVVVVGAWRRILVNFDASCTVYFCGTFTPSDVVPPTVKLPIASLSDDWYLALAPAPNWTVPTPSAEFADAPASMTMNATNTAVAAARAESCLTRCAALRSPGTAFVICI